MTRRGQLLKQRYKPDLIRYEKIILEIKAVCQLTDGHRAQLLNYLDATRMKVGIFVNFGHQYTLESERIVLETHEADDLQSLFYSCRFV